MRTEQFNGGEIKTQKVEEGRGEMKNRCEQGQLKAGREEE